jgi:hypothetical protein
MRQVMFVALFVTTLTASGAGCGDEHVVNVRVRTLSSETCDGLAPLPQWPEERSCALLRARDSRGAPVPLRAPGTPDEQRFGAILLPRSSTNVSTVSLDLPPAQEHVTVELSVYDQSGALLASGQSLPGPLCSGCSVSLTLSPPARFSCTGAGTEGQGPEQFATERRALHSATLLSNGEVLILGGVSVSSEEAVIPRDQATEVPLARRIEVYDPSIGGFVWPTVHNRVAGDEQGFFRRVFHTPVYLGVDPETGFHRLRVFGGITAPPRSTGLALRWAPSSDDETYLPRVFRIPMVPGNNATNAPPVDITYDPATRSVTIEEVVIESITALRRTSLSRSITVGNSTVLSAGMYLSTDNSLRVEDDWFFVNPPDGAIGQGEVFDLRVQRVGHSITLLGNDPWVALVWGGDVRSADDDLPTADGFPHNRDNCPWISNPTQENTGSDAWGDACRDDWDSDLVLNADDNCPEAPNADQSDLDGDGTGDLCDPEGPGATSIGELLSSMVRGSSRLDRSATSGGGPNKLPLESVFHGSVSIEAGAVLIYGGYKLSRFGVLFPNSRVDTPANLPGAYAVVLDSMAADRGEVHFQTLDEGDPWPRVILSTMTPLSDPFDGAPSHQILILGGAEAGPVDRSALMAPGGLARLVTLSRNALGLFDVVCEDLGTSFGNGCVSSPTSAPHHDRWGHTATRLQDGTVLIVGGFTIQEDDSGLHPVWQAEVFNPTSRALRVPSWGGSTACPTLEDGAIGLEPITVIPDAGVPDADDAGPDGDADADSDMDADHDGTDADGGSDADHDGDASDGA